MEAACLIGFPCWQAMDDPEKATVEEVEEMFAKVCFSCDEAMNEAAAVRWTLRWFDETPREEMRRHLLPEVELAIIEREAARG